MEDLRPGGCLVSGALHEFDDFAQHLSQRLRKQYLHDLFPDESQQPMYQDEEPWREFTVSRQRLVADSEAQELTLTK